MAQSTLKQSFQHSQFFTHEQKNLLDTSHLPKHIAIIPDGNRRWAKIMCGNAQMGHREGANIIMDTVKAARELGIKVITFYLFSTENWSRPQIEVAALMWLLQEFLIDNRQEMIDLGVRLHTIGNINAFNPEVINVINDSLTATSEGSDIDMVLALNYGGRDDIRRALQAICKLNIDPSEITEELIQKHLDTASFGDPDLLIRTSGEMRVSNFLLWQLSYSELYVTDVLWPDFTPNDFLDAIIDFQCRQRRHGGS